MVSLNFTGRKGQIKNCAVWNPGILSVLKISQTFILCQNSNQVTKMAPAKTHESENMSGVLINFGSKFTKSYIDKTT